MELEMKRENERENEREDQGDHEKMKDRDERKMFCFFFFWKCLRTPTPPDELAQNVSNKNLFRMNYSSIFLKSSESNRVFNVLHDLNSMFWLGQ